MWEFPTTVGVQPVTEAVDGTTKLASNPARGSSANIVCDIQGRTPGRAFDEFGIEARNPAVMYFKSTDLASVSIGATVTSGSIKYNVLTVPVVRDADTDMAYAMCLLERLDHG